MNNIHLLCNAAHSLDEKITIEYKNKTFVFTVSILNVLHRAKADIYMRNNIKGQGYSIEEACLDYINKCKDATLIHTFSNKEYLVES